MFYFEEIALSASGGVHNDNLLRVLIPHPHLQPEQTVYFNTFLK